MRGKIIVSILSVLLVIGLLAGCGSEGSSSAAKTGNANNVDAVLQDRIDEAEGNTEAETETAPTEYQGISSFYEEGQEMETPDIYSTEGIDLDLTQLNSTMLYAQVNQMMYKPEKYIGKMVMVPGKFSAVYSEEAGKYYYGCLVTDQTACCTLGVEFELPETMHYPEDYPAENEPITVCGTFDTYQEGPYTYCVLRNAKLVS